MCRNRNIFPIDITIAKMIDKVLLVIFVLVSTYVYKKVHSSENSKTKFCFYFSVYYISGTILACVIWPIFLLRPKSVYNSKMAANILKHITKLYDLKWEVRNGEVLAEDRGAVVVSNHQSTLDVLGIFNFWHLVDKLAVVAKKELFYVWPFGLAAYLAGVVFVDRKNAKGAYQQLKQASEAMNKNKTKLWLFPEGTRNRDHTKLLPFKKGAFVIAVTAQTPIIPVVFSPYYFIDEKKYIFNRGHVIVNCLEPVSTKGMTLDDVPELMERVHRRMDNVYKELGKEVLNNLPSGYTNSLRSNQ